jgi:hypothetical protein
MTAPVQPIQARACVGALKGAIVFRDAGALATRGRGLRLVGIAIARSMTRTGSACAVKIELVGLRLRLADPFVNARSAVRVERLDRLERETCRQRLGRRVDTS